MPVVRAYRRVMAPLVESMQYAEHMDAGFDGGEWSGPAHAQQMERTEFEVAGRVLGKFGLSADPQVLLDAAYCVEHEEWSRSIGQEVYHAAL